MTPFLLTRKVGMTQIFTEQGEVVPVTILQGEPGVVTQIKTTAKDGYSAVQVGFGSTKKLTKPQAGHLAKSKAIAKTLREVRLNEDEAELKVGETIDTHQFDNVTSVTVVGTSKGKGFAGVIKRHNFHRGPKTHGSDHHRAPGSIGSMFPQRTLKGRRLPGHLGHQTVTVTGLDLIKVDTKTNVLAVRGAVPGASGSLIEVHGVIK